MSKKTGVSVVERYEQVFFRLGMQQLDVALLVAALLEAWDPKGRKSFKAHVLFLEGILDHIHSSR